MDKWMNVAGRAGTGAAIAGVSMTYYALMRRNAEIERQQIQNQEVVIAPTDLEALKESKDNPGNGDDEESDRKIKSKLESTSGKKKDRSKNAKVSKESMNNINNIVLDQADLTEFDADSLTDSECILCDELPWFSKSSKSMHGRSDDNLNGNILESSVAETSSDIEAASSATFQLEDVNGNYSTCSSSVSNDVSNDSSTIIDRCPEPCEPPPVLRTISRRVLQKASRIMGTRVMNNSDQVLGEYIPPNSWVAWPLKFFPARYANYVLAAIALLFWILCVFLTYCTLGFLYYSLGWKRYASNVNPVPSSIAESDLDVTDVEDYYEGSIPPHWHW